MSKTIEITYLVSLYREVGSVPVCSTFSNFVDAKNKCKKWNDVRESHSFTITEIKKSTTTEIVFDSNKMVDLIAHDIVSVQPMTRSTGFAFAIRELFNKGTISE